MFESGGELFLAVGYTPAGAPFGPRVEIVDGELVFPDEPHVGADECDEAAPTWAPSPLDHDSPF